MQRRCVAPGGELAYTPRERLSYNPAQAGIRRREAPESSSPYKGRGRRERGGRGYWERGRCPVSPYP